MRRTTPIGISICPAESGTCRFCRRRPSTTFSAATRRACSSCRRAASSKGRTSSGSAPSRREGVEACATCSVRSLSPFGERVGARGSLGKPRDHNPSPRPSPYGRGSRLRSRHRQWCQFTPWRVIALLCAACVFAASARAQPAVEDFYKGRQVNLIVGYGPGGGYDVVARLLARYLGRYVAGNPNIVVQNMPGAGSLRATNYLYSVAPKDGTTIGLFGSDMPLIGLIANNPNVQFD